MNLEHPLFVNLPLAMEAFSDYPGNSIDRRVFADISQFANRQGRAFTTEKAIAARTGLRREEVSKSVNRLKEKGFLTITQAKKGLDRHPRNVYYIAKRFLRRHPDKRSPHYSAEKWRRWCEIGKKRAITIALRKKQAAQAAARTVRDTAAAMAGKRPTTASASPLTPAQERDARQQRGGGFAAFGSVLAGLFRPTPAAAATPADTYATELQRRGEIAQTLRENEARRQTAQAATVMAIQLPQQTAAPMIATLAVPPMTQDRAAARASQPEPVSTASKQYETDLSAEPLPIYYQQQETATATHTWRDNVPAASRHKTATGEAMKTTAPAETVAAPSSAEPLPIYYQQQETATATHTWRDNVPAASRHKTATVGATASTETPAKPADSSHTWRDNVPGYRHEAQGQIELKPGSPATMGA